MNNYSTTELIPYRIRIGVTGHRSFEKIETIREKIREAITYKIYELYDKESKITINTLKNTPIALSIITPLAEGADRIVSYEVLETRELQTESGKVIPISDARLEAVLPLKKADYLEDFETEDSKAEFEELISKSRRPISLKENLLKVEIGNGDLDEARKEAYLSVGKYVVDNCDVLIALWNGKPAAGKGGTAEIVKYAEKKSRPVLIISTVDPNSEITILKGSGLNSESLRNLDFFNSYELEEDSKKNYIKNIYDSYFPVYPRAKSKRKSFLKRIKNKFENLFYYGAFSPQQDKSKTGARDEKKLTDEELNKIISSIPPETKKLIRYKLFPYYAKASSISKKYQRKYLRAGTLVYTLTAVSAILIATVIFYHPASKIIFPLLFVILSLVYLIVMIADRNEVRKRWIESRFLAERIRSSVFLAICGTEVSPINIPPYNAEALKVDDWMIVAFDEIWKKTTAMTGCPENLLKDCSNYVINYWIEDQIKYHTSKSIKSGKKNWFFEKAGLYIFFLAVIVALLHTIFAFLNIEEEILLSIVIILPAMGAAAGGIRAHREFSRLEKRSRSMVQPLSNFKETLETMDDPKDFEITLRNIEKLMLDETQDWLMIMRFVDLKPEA